MKTILFLLILVGNAYAQDTSTVNCLRREPLYSGECKTYREFGSLAEHSLYKDGEVVWTYRYYKDSSIQVHSDYSKLNQSTFFLESYYPKGKRKEWLDVKNGTGKLESYYPEGKVMVTGTVKKGRLIKPWLVFSEDGLASDTLDDTFYNVEATSGEALRNSMFLAVSQLMNKQKLFNKRRLLTNDETNKERDLEPIPMNASGGAVVTIPPVLPPKDINPVAEIIEFPDVEPSFPGGSQAMIDFIKQNIVYPDIAKGEEIYGRVYCSFVVEPDGKLTNITVDRSPNEVLSKEAIRVIELMPSWIPGESQGKKVRMKVRLPIDFKLQ